MPHLWYLCFMYGDLLWPDLDLEPSLISNIYSISALPYILGVFGVSFGPKLIILRSLWLVTWKPWFWPLTWYVTLFGKFRGCFRIVSSRAFERRVARLSAAIRSRVMTWGRLTLALMGLWIFHHLLGGGGGVWTPPPPVYLGSCVS